MKTQPRGHSDTGYVAIVNGRRMEFVSYEDYLEYIREESAA